MKHYINDKTLEIYAYESDGSQDHLIKNGLREITSDEELAQKRKEQIENKPYTEKRILAYPTIQDQLDMQYHDAINGTTTWKDAIAKVKTDNPKENE